MTDSFPFFNIISFYNKKPMANPNKKSSDKKKQPFDKKALIELIWIDLVNGVSRYQIMLKLERNAYDGFDTSKLGRTSKYNYIQEAYKNCAFERAEEKEKQRDLFYERILSVYNDAIENRDRQNALKALDMGIKLGGLYEQQQDINLNGTIKANISFGIEEENNGD